MSSQQRFVEVRDRRTAKKRCPWAAKLVKVCGGYMAFECLDDYARWRNDGAHGGDGRSLP